VIGVGRVKTPTLAIGLRQTRAKSASRA